MQSLAFSQRDLGWLAGMVDGEGYVGYYARSDSGGYSLQLVMRNTDERTVRRFHELVGVGRVAYEPTRLPNRKPTWVWLTQDASARRVLEVLLPALVTKRERAELVLAVPTKRRGPYSVWKRIAQAVVACEMKRLNKRGLPT